MPNGIHITPLAGRTLLFCCMVPAFLLGMGRLQEGLVLTPDTPTYTLEHHLYLLPDPSHAFTLHDVTHTPLARQFVSTQQQPLPQGFSPGAYWLRFTLQHDDATAWLLEVYNKGLDSLSLYIPFSPDSLIAYHTGDHRGFHSRPFKHRNFVFPLPSVGGHAQTYYLRYASKDPIEAPVQLWTREAFRKKDLRAQFILGIFLGILFVIALYNLLLYFSIRDVSFLYYVFYVGTYLLFQLSQERIGFEYLWSEAVWWEDRSNNMLALLCFCFAIQFSRSFLETRQRVPRADALLLALMGVTLPLFVLNVLSAKPLSNQLTWYFSVVVALALIGAGVWSLRRGNRVARYYLIAWTFMLGGVVLYIVSLLTPLLSRHVGSYLLQLGSVLEMTLLSLGLGYRYASMRQAREHLRLRIAADLHDDLGSGLTQIALYSELIRQKTDGPEALWAQQIGQTARTLTGTMQDIVWAIKPTEDTWDSLELRMKDHATQLLAPHQIRLDMQGTVEYQHRHLPIDTRQNVLLMFKEILHNAVKYARCQRVKVRWRLSRQTLRLEVSDDGVGFDPSAAAGQGNGLGNLNHRAEQIGALLTIDATPGAGTRFVIEAPV